MRYRCATEPDVPKAMVTLLNRHKSALTYVKMTLAGLEPAIFGSEDRRLIH